MSGSFRRFRFDRKAVRAPWYVEPWLYGSFAVSLPVLVVMLGAQRSGVAWAACAALLGLIAWRWWRQRAYEAAFWARKRALQVWFEDGRLQAAADGVPQPPSEPLHEVAAVDVVFERGRPARLLVARPDGSRAVYAGFDDMEAFAREFRLAAPGATFRRVQRAFPMKLKEF